MTSQLEEHVVRLREELDREREERSYFQLERDKSHAFWEISKRGLEEVKAELRNRQREGEEAEERHRVEIAVSCTRSAHTHRSIWFGCFSGVTCKACVVGVQVYKQKLKRVLSEHHNTTSGLKMDSVAASSLIQNQRAEAELGLRREVHGLQADFREKQRHNQNCMEELKLVSLGDSSVSCFLSTAELRSVWLSTETPGGVHGTGKQLR